MNSINKTCRKLIGLLVITVVTSCKKFVEVSPPDNQVIASQVFTDPQKATAAVTAMYGFMINGAPAYSNHLTTVYAGIAADELSRFNPTTVFQEFMSNNITTANPNTKIIWSGLYKTVYNANACIEGLEKSVSLQPALVQQLKAECLVVRSLAYFYLINLFDDVPLILTTNYTVNAKAPRTPVQEIWNRMETDLLEAQQYLAPNDALTEKVRPGKMAALALLSRCYLYTQQWNKAEEAAMQIINSGRFLPLQEPGLVFLKNSKEAIWQLMPNNGFMQETRQMRPLGTTPQTVITTHQLTAFEPNDKRRSSWLDSGTHTSGKFFFPAKYRNTAVAITEYYMVFRAAEQLLIAAEAMAHQNKITEAIQLINLLRSRAALPGLSVNISKENLLLAIEQERRVELFAEWGHRWFDLKRTNRINTVLAANKPGWQPFAALWPIPLDEILTNSNLSQNPGY